MLDRVVGVLRTRPRLFFSLGVLYTLPLLGVLGLYYWLRAPKDLNQVFGEITPWILGAQLLGEWANAAVIASSFQLLLFPSRPLLLWVALRGSLNRLFFLVLTRLFVWLVLGLGLSIPSQLFSGGSAGGALDAISLILSLWILFAALYFMVLWMLTPVVVMVERVAFVRAMRRSMELLRLVFRPGWMGDSALRRLGVIMVLPVTVWLVQLLAVQGLSWVVTGHPVSLAPFFPPSDQALISLTLITFPKTVFYAGSVVAACGWFVTGIWLYAALVLLYAECRMRYEALDIQVRMLARGDTALPEAELAGF
jgi:hypothetical protein